MQNHSQANLCILEGNIAAGKTTLLKALESQFGAFAIEEPVEGNPFLEKFYADPAKYAFPFQMWFLELRIRHYRTAVEFARAHPEKVVVLDRSVFSDYVFALNCTNDGFITQEQFHQYMERYTAALRELPTPGIAVYLNVPASVCHDRVLNVRCRECEKGIPLEYLQGLESCYRELFIQLKALGAKTEIVDWQRFGSAEDIYRLCAEASVALSE